MKFLYLPLVVLLICCKSAKSEKTGIVYAGHFEILNKTATSDKWNDLLQKNGFAPTLSTFRIRKNLDGETEENYYCLFAESADMNVKAAMLLRREKNYFYADAASEFIVCACMEGSPRRYGNKWICESQTDESDCTETILAAK